MDSPLRRVHRQQVEDPHRTVQREHNVMHNTPFKRPNIKKIIKTGWGDLEGKSMKTGGRCQHLCKPRAREAETGRSLALSGQPAELNP